MASSNKGTPATAAKQILLFDIAESLEHALEIPAILKQRGSSVSAQGNKSAKSSAGRQSRLPSINPQGSAMVTSGINTAASPLSPRKVSSSAKTGIMDSPALAEPTLSQNGKVRHATEIQTDPFLEPLPCILEMSMISTQTDEFLPRPPSPLFIPKSSGLDKGTEIGLGDLFDFDREIAPVVESIVSQAVEHAWIEATEELDLDRLKVRMRVFERRRINEQAEVLRLEEAEKRRQEEKQRRLDEQLVKMQERDQAQSLRVIHQMAHDSVNRVIKDVYQVLDTAGFFAGQQEQAISQNVWQGLLLPAVSVELDSIKEADGFVDDLIQLALSYA